MPFLNTPSSDLPVQPVTIRIQGEYIDSYLYSGTLYLFNNDARVTKINWNRLVAEKFGSAEDSVAIRCAFSQSGYLYGKKFSFIFQDREIKSVVQDKFRRLSTRSLDIDSADLSQYIQGEVDYNHIFPHADFSISDDRVFASSIDGLWRGAKSSAQDQLVDGDFDKIWDLPSGTVSPARDRLAVAAGEEGLFEVGLDKARPDFKAGRLSKQHCSSCSRAYQSIYGSSLVSGGYLASFDNTKHVDPSTKKESYIRTYEGEINAKNIFGSAARYTWGAQNRIYSLYDDRTLKIVRYCPWLDGEERLQTIREIRIQDYKGDIISAGAALFGSVVEFSNAIVILRSDGKDPFTIDDTFVNWRIFPRSRNYENHLHVVRENYLEIYSFNHDYFVEQQSKIYGFSKFIERSFKGFDYNADAI